MEDRQESQPANHPSRGPIEIKHQEGHAYHNWKIGQGEERDLGDHYRIKIMDVVCGGRGTKDVNQMHPGNMRFKLTVMMRLDKYQAAGKSKSKKSTIIKEIVNAVYESGGSFVKKEGDSWFDIGAIKARDKVSTVATYRGQQDRPLEWVRPEHLVVADSARSLSSSAAVASPYMTAKEVVTSQRSITMIKNNHGAASKRSIVLSGRAKTGRVEALDNINVFTCDSLMSHLGIPDISSGGGI
eukprot:CAMPEP_0198149564 /NCGR_PEP_ID=MMETSP1443-20131203/47212_1 /TAXON_ID=186043 /ORGANISM="Entomoneis sp., Strain CCMP2396" /LENGTH=240 /DNA_ID=CAMNT_0043814645 /DNA_START=78 /DNA_END=800 /DNA_ORIENTATION=+